MADGRAQYSPEGWAAWELAGAASQVRLGAAAPTPFRATLLAHTSAVVQFGALLDVVLDPVGILVREGEGGVYAPRFPTARAGAETLPVIGSRSTDATLRALRDRAAGDAAAVEQRAYAGALGLLLRDLGRATPERSSGRAAGLLLAIPAGYYIIAGIVSVGLVAVAAVVTYLQESGETARRSEVLAGAGEDYAARLAVARGGAAMPPPSARETAARAAIDQDAHTFWSEFGRGLGGAADTASKGLVWGGLILGALLIFSKQRSGSNG